MNALRQIIEAKSTTLSILLPKEYQKQTLEVIILPFTNQKNDTQSINDRKRAFEVIDRGITIKDSDKFLSEFHESRQDRTLLFRD